MSYRSEHFLIHELVPRHVLEERGDAAWELLDENLLRLDDQLREKFGPIIINTWHSNHLQELCAKRYRELNFPASWSPLREWSGLRTPNSPYYHPYSQHSFGRATDKIFLNYSTEHVRNYILTHLEEFPLLKSMELNTQWLHSDVRNCSRVKTYNP